MPTHRPEPVRVVEVWETHWDAVTVFQLCPVAGIGHMGGVHWQGIAPESIQAALQLMRLPRSSWPDMADDVAYMGSCVAAERNQQAAGKVKR